MLVDPRFVRKQWPLVGKTEHILCVVSQILPFTVRVCLYGLDCKVCYFFSFYTRGMMYVPRREKDRVSNRKDVWELQSISLSCWWNRRIFQDVAACGPRYCLSRMTPFTSIHQRPVRPPLTLGLRLWARRKKKHKEDELERNDGMWSVFPSWVLFNFYLPGAVPLQAKTKMNNIQ